MPGEELIQLQEGRAALARAVEAGEIHELKRIGDMASAAKQFARAQGMSEEAKRFAAEMELDAKRCLGVVLAKQEKQTGGHAMKARFSEGTEVPPKLADLGVTKKQSSDAQKLASIPDEDYEQFKASARSDSLTTKRALRVAREREASQRRSTAPVIPLPEDIDIRRCDLRDLEVTGVDAIITDPPYPAEFIGEFDALGELAARALKPGGLLAAMVGQSHLPAYVEKLSQHLDYRWCGAYLTDGSATRVHGRKVGTKWKPILIFGGESFITQDVFSS